MAEFDPVKGHTGTSTDGRRGASRDSLFLSATIRRRGEDGIEPAPVRVRNLSARGMMADNQLPWAPDDQVVVTLRGIGSVPGRIAWVKPGRIGVSFDVPVDPKLARKPVATPARVEPPKLRPL